LMAVVTTLATTPVLHRLTRGKGQAQSELGGVSHGR
jgi:hypothetical protein